MVFLTECCKQILHDIPTDSLISDSYPIQPEPPSKSENNVTRHTSLAVMAAERPYRLPSSLDISRIVSLPYGRTRVISISASWKLVSIVKKCSTTPTVGRIPSFNRIVKMCSGIASPERLSLIHMSGLNHSPNFRGKRRTCTIFSPNITSRYLRIGICLRSTLMHCSNLDFIFSSQQKALLACSRE